MGNAGQGPTLDWETAPEEFRKAYSDVIEERKAEVERLKSLEDEVAGVRRTGAFNTALEAAKDRLPEGVTLDPSDIPSDLPIDQITSTLIEVTAANKLKSRQEAELKFAQELGFETVDAYQEFRAAAEQARAQNNAALGTNAQVAAAGTPTTTLNINQTPKEQAQAAYLVYKQMNRPEDECQAEYTRVLREATPVGTPQQ